MLKDIIQGNWKDIAFLILAALQINDYDEKSLK